MARIIITASNDGFFNDSPVGAPLAPNVLLKTGVNATGNVLSFDGTDWCTEESLRYAGQDISVAATFDNILDPQLGQTTEVLVSSVSYSRMIDGEMVQIGVMELPEPLVVTATYLSFGVEDIPAWQFDLGDAIADMLQTAGLKFNGGAGDDIFNPHMDMLPFRGNAVINGRGGNDQLTGTYGDDRIRGGTGDDVIYAEGGSNVLKGGSGDDVITVGNRSDSSVLKGGSGNDTLTSGWGDDILLGKSGRDTLNGGRGEDQLSGGKGRDVLDGGAGNDVINGGAGSDMLTGGQGADVFLFTKGERGRDTVTDFEDGTDMLRFDGVSGFEDLTITQNGADTWITIDGAPGRIVLDGIDSSLIDAADFLFS